MDGDEYTLRLKTEGVTSRDSVYYGLKSCIFIEIDDLFVTGRKA